MSISRERNELSRKRRRLEEFDQRQIELETRLHDIEVEKRLRRQRHIPDGWRDLAREAPCAPRKGKLTLSLDQDMIDWYRTLGRGYGNRINAVLRLYMMNLINEEVKRRG